MRFLAVVALGLSFNASAVSLRCVENDDTRGTTCFNPLKVRSNGELRSTKIYSGGPNEVQDNGFTAVMYCNLQYIELRDRQGVVFARNRPTTKHAFSLWRQVCEADAKPDKTLR